MGLLSSHNLAIVTGNATRVLVDTSGNVGIGTTTPNKSGFSNAVTVNGATNAGFEVAVGDTRIAGLYAASSAVVLNAFANVPMYFSTNNTTRMTLDTSGSLSVTGDISAGANVYVPSGIVAVGSGGKQMYIRSLYGSNRIDSYDNPITATQPLIINASTLTFQIADSTKMYIDGSGNVGIGTSSPSTKLQVHATGIAYNTAGLFVTTAGGTDGLAIGDSGSGAYKSIQSYGGVLSLNSLGNNVGIGTTTAGANTAANSMLSQTMLGRIDLRQITNTDILADYQ
jgi:hypothetical protein